MAQNLSLSCLKVILFVFCCFGLACLREGKKAGNCIVQAQGNCKQMASNKK